MSKSIAVLGSDQVPLAYTVPVPGTLTPLTASAVFNGSGAGAFLPCVSFYDSDGNLITRATAPEVAAGGSAEVSWFPFSGGVAATTSASVALTYASGGGFTVPANSSEAAGFGNTNISDPSVFTWSTTTNPNDTLTVHPSGAVICITTALINVGSANCNIYVDNPSGGIFRHTAWPTPQGGDGNPPPEGFSVMMDQAWGDLSANDSTIQFVFSNGNGFDDGPVNMQAAVLFFAGANT